jgi:alginate O-acetyltransferase complex protein AlgI
VPDIALPIGISFFMFQALSYVIDVYREKGEVQKNILNVALYISFFPQLIAGPIVRYETIADQIKNRKETLDDFIDGVCRFIIGLGKKVLIANTLALVADSAFAQPNISVAFAWVGALAYTFQIFYDFAGYSDMALGLGKMFGFHFLENFNYPYISKSISEFWRRWHISLGSWFRDYVYFPLGGSRVDSKARLVFNLFAVRFLTGVWHGANWTFILWGLMYFVLIALEKLTGFDKKLKFFGHIYTLFFVIIGWVLFRASDITHAIEYLRAMFGLAGNALYNGISVFELTDNKFFFIAGLLFSFPIAPWLKKKLGNSIISNIIYPILMTAVFIISVSYIVKGSYNPFIYFNF